MQTAIVTATKMKLFPFSGVHVIAIMSIQKATVVMVFKIAFFKVLRTLRFPFFPFITPPFALVVCDDRSAPLTNRAI